MQPTVLQILDRLGMTVELQLVEGGSCFQHAVAFLGRDWLPEVGDALLEGQALGELDKADQIAAAAAAMAVEEILAGVDVERRPVFPM